MHRDQIERYGGRLGVRDMGLLESALAMPQAGVGGRLLHADVFEMAAACLYYIIKDHPFVDGDKRVGAMAAFTFLRLNGIILDAPERGFEELVRAVAAGKEDKAVVAAFIRKHIQG